MKKKNVVKDKRLFNKIIKTSKFIKNDYYVIYFSENNLQYNRYGLAVSKKLGNAVFRNKIKRRLRNIIDNNNFLFKNSYDYIIMIKRGKNNYNYNILEQKLKKILNGEKK